MRLACFTPLPPQKSGIADYAAALLPKLAEKAQVEAFADQAECSIPGLQPRHWSAYKPEQFDVALYQIGNNPDHVFAYRQALQHAGAVTLHEFNLHHLLTDVTIRAGDWDGYLREAEYNGGPEALAHAKRVRALEVGPDYDNLPMNRRLLETSLGLVVHSRFMAGQVRNVGWKKPIAIIPHGAAVSDVNAQACRRRLGIEGDTPLIGMFGFLKPYKRVPECLRAFRKLLSVEPRARMILAGEEHPELDVRGLVASLGLEPQVRILGYATPDEFERYIGCADICLNLRYPTAGETSGTLLRALGAGRAVLVSEIGAFAELPEDICFKVPVGEGEEDFIFEYLTLLIARPEIARAVGDRARAFVAQQCAWDRVAGQYLEFLAALSEGRQWPELNAPHPSHFPAVRVEDAPHAATAAEQEKGPGVAPATRATTDACSSRSDGSAVAAAPEPVAATLATSLVADYILDFSSQSQATLDYVRIHLTRLARTLEVTPRGTASDRVLEMGAYMQITPALRDLLGYGQVHGCYRGPAGQSEHVEVRSKSGRSFSCPVALFDAERDAFPYPDNFFTTVLCCELIEHLYDDPMHMMSEINRILRPGGTLVLTTPNICSLRSVAAILLGYHPGIFPHYIRPAANGKSEPRHAREYAPREIEELLNQSGFAVTLLETGPFFAKPSVAGEWVARLLEKYDLPRDLRAEGIYAVGRKVSGVKERYPRDFYA